MHSVEEEKAFVFDQFRKVICDIYFAGWKDACVCAGCCDQEECYRMIREAMDYAKDLSQKTAEWQCLGEAN